LGTEEKQLMNILYDFVNVLQGTRIPFVFVVVGVVLILFPFAGNFSGKIPLTRTWQKLAGFAGFVLLTGGLWLLIAPAADKSQIAGNPAAELPAGQYELADPFSEEELKLLKEEVAYLQKAAIDALEAGRLGEADIALIEAEALISAALSRSPDDSAILYQNGCLHRNVATVYQRLAMGPQVEQNLGHAERAFRLIVSFHSDDPCAWKNLGDIYILRDDLDRAEACVRKALELDPGYEAARDDLTWILAHQ
jgi:tetratricopeptide (TPR) repeat protein